eukprot:m.207598 g.207598  ORF g.207598 m.207598 type:complete len:493 (+) comp23838_c0_seq1:83-1561(+)
MMMGEAFGGGGPIEPTQHAISASDRDMQLAANREEGDSDDHSEGGNDDGGAGGVHTHQPARLINANDAVLIDADYVRPIRERHDAVRQLGFEWTSARLRDGSAVVVVGNVDNVGICTPRYAAATAVALHPGAEAEGRGGGGRPTTVEQGDVIIKLNKVVLADEQAELIPVLLRQAGQLDRLTVRALRAHDDALERVIEHGLKAVVAARIDSSLVAEDMMHSGASAAAEEDGNGHRTDGRPLSGPVALPFAAALVDALGLASSDSGPTVGLRRKHERARAHALLSRELVHKLNAKRATEAAVGPAQTTTQHPQGHAPASTTDHPLTPVWLALASFGAGEDDAVDACRTALALDHVQRDDTNAGKRRRLALHGACARALASSGHVDGALEQLWLEMGEAEAGHNTSAVVRCLFDAATVTEHRALSAAGVAGMWQPLDQQAADLYRKCLAEARHRGTRTLSYTHRTWLATAASKVDESPPEGCEDSADEGTCRVM